MATIACKWHIKPYLNTISLPWYQGKIDKVCKLLLASVTQHAGFRRFSGPFAWALALVKPQYLGVYPKGHWAFPSTYSIIMWEVSLPQIRFIRALRCVASCKLLPGEYVRGQQDSEICLFVRGPCCMSYCVLFHTGLFLKRQSGWQVVQKQFSIGFQVL